MSKNLFAAVIGVALALVLVFSMQSAAQAEQRDMSSWIKVQHATSVDRDLATYHWNDANRFGMDQAYNYSGGGLDRDADFRANNFVPETYGLMGNYWRAGEP